MQPVTITLDQNVISGHPGMTILEVAQEAGIKIPTLCEHPNLEPVGACRICMVEDENNGKLMASCVTNISPGMIINTRSPRVINYRKNIAKLLLANHPVSCLVCEKGNRCSLRKLASDLGIDINEFEKIPRHATINEINPFIVRDNSKCILCGKCIRACQEIVVEGVLDYYQRGFDTRPAPLFDNPLEESECTFCGTCVAMCPTGALQEKEKLYRGTTMSSVETTCSFCGCGCPLTLKTKGNLVIRALPSERASTYNYGSLCVRGSYGYDYIHSKERLTFPLLKENGEFREASWDEALHMAARGLEKVKEDHGSESLAVYGSSKCTNEENYLLQRFARTVLDTNNIDNGSSLYNSIIRDGLDSIIGLFGTVNLIDALEQPDLVMVVGSDPTVTAPQVGYTLKRAVKFNEAKLILINPLESGLRPFAHKWLSAPPGSTTLLLNNICRIIVEEDLYDAEFVTRKTEGFDSYVEELKEFSLDYCAEKTGINKKDILEAARYYARTQNSVIVFDSDITSTIDGVDTIRAIANLALLTGHIWGKGGGIFPLQKECNGQGACDMGALPDLLPGYLKLSDDSSREKFENMWQSTIPTDKGTRGMEWFLQEENENQVRGMYVVGENPLARLPRSDLVDEKLDGLDFLVVQELFMTDTARMANVVLPGASFAEKSGSFTNFEGRIGWLSQAVLPPGDCMADWNIILRLSEKMEKPLPYSSLKQVMEEIEEYVLLYEGYFQPEGTAWKDYSFWEKRHHKVLNSLGGFPKFFSVSEEPAEEKNVKEFPYKLVLEEELTHFGSGSRSMNSSRLQRDYENGYLEISPKDGEELSINTGDRVKITSFENTRLTIPVKMSKRITSKIARLPLSYPGALKLMSAGSKVSHVKLERVND